MKNINTFFDVNSFLGFAEDTIKNHISSCEKQNELEKLASSINSRLKDDNLYLAIIGEFSSGKSTFINGILQKKILKAACEATTASATYIIPGKEFKIITKFLDGQEILASESNYNELFNKINSLPANELKKGSTIFQLLDMLTSDQAVANNVINIKVEYPVEDIWQKNLVIIDTPGISSGIETGQSHFEITEGIIDNIADAVIILIPSETAMSKTLIEFLTEHLKRFITRCIFILTAVDRILPEERDELLKYVQFQLKEKIGLKEQEVYMSSAISMIPAQNIPSSMNEEWVSWQERFLDLRNKIFDTLKKQRNVIISERLSYLMQNLSTEINKELFLKQEKLKIEVRVLKNGNIQKVEDVVNSLLEVSIRKVDVQKSKLISLAQNLIYKYEVNAINKSDEIIEAAGWGIKSYDTAIEPKIKAVVENEAKSYIDSINKNNSFLHTCCADICDNFVEQFKSNYKTFDTLNVKLTPPSLIVNSMQTPKLEFQASKRYLSQQESEDKAGGSIGAVIGGVIGSLLLPGFGTIIGAALGGGVGHGVSGDSLVDRQITLKAHSKNEIKKFFTTYLSEVDKEINTIIISIVKEFKKICNNHISEYKQKVSDLIFEHNEKEKILRTEIKVINGLSEKFTKFIEELALIEIELNQIK